MNIGIIVLGMSTESGGGFTFENEILLNLQKASQGSRHTFYCFTDNDTFIAENKSDSFRTIRIPSPSTKKQSVSIAFLKNKLRRVVGRKSRQQLWEQSVKNILSQHKIEFVWHLSPFHLTLDIPYAAIVWDLQHRKQPFFPEVSNNGVWKNRETILTPHLQRATTVVVGTDVGQDEVERFYGVAPERFIKLPHPTPAFVLDCDPSQFTKPIQTQHPYVFYPAQFWPHKNHTLLLQSLAELRKKHGVILEAILTGADHGNLSYVKEMAKSLGLEEHVHFPGFVTREELIGLYANAFAMVYPSFFGPENLPPLEAFALNCPVIAANVAGAEEQLGDAAILFAPDNVIELTESLLNLNNDPDLRKRLVSKGFDRAHAWTGEDFVQGMLTFLDSFETTRSCWGA